MAHTSSYDQLAKHFDDLINRTKIPSRRFPSSSSTSLVSGHLNDQSNSSISLQPSSISYPSLTTSSRGLRRSHSGRVQRKLKAVLSVSPAIDKRKKTPKIEMNGGSSSSQSLSSFSSSRSSSSSSSLGRSLSTSSSFSSRKKRDILVEAEPQDIPFPEALQDAYGKFYQFFDQLLCRLSGKINLAQLQYEREKDLSVLMSIVATIRSNLLHNFTESAQLIHILTGGTKEDVQLPTSDQASFDLWSLLISWSVPADLSNTIIALYEISLTTYGRIVTFLERYEKTTGLNSNVFKKVSDGLKHDFEKLIAQFHKLQDNLPKPVEFLKRIFSSEFLASHENVFDLSIE